MNQIKETPAFVIHGIDDAMAAVAAARSVGVPVVLVSAPGAAAYAGPGWFLEIVALARAEAPEPGVSGVLDCADHPGLVMAALRAGAAEIVFTGDRRVAEKLSSLAGAHGATIRADRPPAFDPGAEADKQAACRAWLERG